MLNNTQQSTLEENFHISARPCNILYVYWKIAEMSLPINDKNQQKRTINLQLRCMD